MSQRTYVRRNVRSWPLWFVLLALGISLAPARGDEPPAKAPESAGKSASPRVSDLVIGFDGRAKVGYWAPAVIEIKAGSEPFRGHLEIIVPDNDGVLTRVAAPPQGELSLEADGVARVPAYFKTGQLGGDLTVELHAESKVLASRVFRAGVGGRLAGLMRSSAPLVLSIGAANVETESASAMTSTDLESLPREWYGLEGVDAVVLQSSDPRMVDVLSAAGEQLASLDQWVRMGGRLVLSVGRQSSKLLASGGPLEDFAPGKYESMVPLRQGTVLEAYVETSDPLAPGATLELEVPRLTDVRGQIEAFAGAGPRDLPLVVRTPRGFGEVIFVAFDIDQQPFVDWKARPQLLAKLLGENKTQSTDSEDGLLGAVTTLGFVDLAGQLRGALDQFPGVPLVPFWLVAVLVVGYIACIGPIDYYLVRHVLRRPASTWLTFGLMVVLFSAGAAALALGLKGRELRVNQLDLVDFDLESGMVRGTSWANLFSPQIDTYDLRFTPKLGFQASPGGAPQPMPTGSLLSWYGLSGNGFGGIDVADSAAGGIGAASSAFPLFSVGYEYGRQLESLENVPIAVWSSKAFVNRWWGYADGGVEAQLRDDGRLTGTLSSKSPVPLTDCVLIYNKWAYVIRDFPPGREIDLEFDIDPQTANTHLRKVTAVGDRQVAATYDQTSFDVPRIVEMMSLHELAEGEKYTGLVNDYQAFVELSELTSRGRAVLLGRVADPVVALERQGNEPLSGPFARGDHVQQWTYFRYVIPVATE